MKELLFPVVTWFHPPNWHPPLTRHFTFLIWNFLMKCSFKSKSLQFLRKNTIQDRMSRSRTRNIRSAVHHSPPRICWLIPVWFKYLTQTLTLTLICVRIFNVSTSVWRMELSVGRYFHTVTKKLGNIFWNTNKRVMQITSPFLAFLSHSIVIEKCKQKKFKTGLRFWNHGKSKIAK